MIKKIIKQIKANTWDAFILTIKASRLTEQVLRKSANLSVDYKEYLKAQIKKSFLKKNANRNKIPNRTIHLVGITKKYLSELNITGTALCVGCRDTYELEYIEETCGLHTIGLDLFSHSDRIVVGDMHKIPFDNSYFNLLYSCHSLEHAKDLRVALNEFIRVLKPNGMLVIEMPVNFTPNSTDYWDLKNSDKLIEMIENRIEKVVYKEDGTNSGNSNKQVIRLIITVKN